ncbi:MAG: TerB family tellurite resistance protein [Candidatus Cloacimonetes bacterium]|nr:TerB family tellurite resistance protein [Candidatus Cloacimonadota bacterium]
MEQETYPGSFEIMQCLISIAWCDNKLDKREIEIISEYLIQFNLNQEEINKLCLMLLNPQPLVEVAEQVPKKDRMFTFSQCYVMAMSDGNLDFTEIQAIKELADLWGIDREDMDRVQNMASEMFKTQMEFRSGKLGVEELIERISHE